ncbi:hypothetical protein OCF84_21270 (plasmid) [Shewanella xiamenensis]|uniref:DUF6884 domain-containing protein n=1 Tax=Shewanella xiamenensis TaxID=332186 RepID=A0ABT6UDP7_9GAMM|nr:DUF6884 domain-containing protein [Shewanella xiamenensis]MDI5832592.1 hypothetical protein [Shewanella xiamenensis]WHF57790.1 hypothetical protein OCF84_21270 [Shewanella xiamenensis]
MDIQSSFPLNTLKSVNDIFLSKHSALIESKRTLILPCSDKKLPVKDIAFNLYQGTGYLSIVKKYTLVDLSDVFNVFFLSAMYGLVSANEILSPYDLKMSHQQIYEFDSNRYLKSKAKRLLKNTNHDMPLYLILPKAYLEALNVLCGDTLSRFKSIEKVSGGILSHRSQLSKLLKNEFCEYRKRTELSQAVITTYTDELPVVTVKHIISVGDLIRPWISGVGNKAEFSDTVRVSSIRCLSSGLLTVEDESGGVWSDYSVSAGIKRHGHITSFW